MKILSADYVLPITQDPVSNGAVAVEDDKIAAVGNKKSIVERYPEAELMDFGDAVLMPGFVNVHSHLELSILRGYLDRFDDDFASWLIELTKTRREILTENDIRFSAEFGAAEGISAGVTCFADIGRYGEAGFYALRKTGLRGVVFQETEFSPDSKTAKDDFSMLFEKFKALCERETALVRAGISPHAPYTVSSALFEKIAEASMLAGFPITIHAAESIEEENLMAKGEGFFADIYEKQGIDWNHPGSSSIEYLSRLGVLTAKPLLAHCVTVSDSDIDLIEKSGSGIAHCPKSNAKFGHGIAPFEKFIRRGVKTGLGSDSVVSNNSCDLIEESRFAVLFARAKEKTDVFLTAGEILRCATLGGAEAMGLENEIGSLEIGKQADIIAVSTKNFAQKPVFDICSSLVFGGTARDVIFTMVAGRELYSGGRFLTVDETEIRKKTDELAEKLRGLNI
ncbi:MAG: amidohydrolase family protein [Pyrinomonadaceae bacterium]